MAEPVCIVPAGDRTGEGAVWHAEEKAVYWVDITRFLIHRYDPGAGTLKSWFFSEPPTALALTDRADTLLVALASKVILWQPQNDARADFALPVKDWPRVRLNDGRPDPAGFFWVGSMQNNVAADGSVVPMTDDAAGRAFPDHGRRRGERGQDGIGITNTLCLEPGRQALLLRRHSAQRDLRLGLRPCHGDDRQRAAVLRGFRARRARRLGDGPRRLSLERPLWRRLRRAGRPRRQGRPRRRACRSATSPPAPSAAPISVRSTSPRPQGGSGPGERLAGGLYALPVETPGMPENKFQ